MNLERMISGTGWINHYLAYSMGHCELNTYCPDDIKDDLLEFLNTLYYSANSPDVVKFYHLEISHIFNEIGDKIGFNVKSFGRECNVTY